MKNNTIQRIILPAAVVLTVLFSSSVFSITQQYLDVLMAGQSSEGKSAYVRISPNPDQCLGGGVYFNSKPITNSNERDYANSNSALSVALLAKTTKTKVRIDYTQPDGAGGQCFGLGIFLR